MQDAQKTVLSVENGHNKKACKWLILQALVCLVVPERFERPTLRFVVSQHTVFQWVKQFRISELRLLT